MNVKPLFSLEDKSERDGTQKMLTVSFGLGFRSLIDDPFPRALVPIR